MLGNSTFVLSSFCMSFSITRTTYKINIYLFMSSDECFHGTNGYEHKMI